MNRVFSFLLFVATLSLGAGVLFVAVPADHASKRNAFEPASEVLKNSQPPQLHESPLPVVSSLSPLLGDSLTTAVSPPPSIESIADIVSPTPSPRVKVLIFDDFLCPHCEQYFLQSLIPFFEAAGEKIEITFYTLPTKGNQSEILGKAAFCAEQAGRGVDFRKALFESDRKLPSDARKIVSSLGIDLQQYDLCINSDNASSHLIESATIASKHGITAVPAVVVGIETITGQVPWENLLHLVQKNIAGLLN